MKVDIDLEEEIEITWDEGKKDIILILKQATDGIEAFQINLNMEFRTLLQLKDAINEFFGG